MGAEAPELKPRWIGALLVLGGGICIGLAPIGLRFGLDTLGAQAIAFWRYTIAAPLLFCLVIAVKGRLPARPNRFVLMAGVLFACNIGLWHWALTLTSVANATFIVGLGNVCSALVAWLFLAQRPGPIWVGAACVALIGAGALSLGGTEGGASNIRGDLIAIGAAIFVAGYVVSANVARRTISGLDLIFWATLVEAVVAAGFTIGFGQSFLPGSPSGFAVPVFLAIVVQIMGQGLILTGLGYTPAAIAGVLLLTQPIVAAAVSWQLFDETLTGVQAAGALLIIAGIAMSQKQNT